MGILSILSSQFVLQINGVSVYGKSHQKASAVIKDIPKDGDVQLIVRRHPQAIDQLAVEPLTPTPTDKVYSSMALRQYIRRLLHGSYPPMLTISKARFQGSLGLPVKVFIPTCICGTD